MGGSQGNQRGLTFMLCVAKKLIAWTGVLPARILVVCVGIRKIVPLPVIGQMIVCNLKRRAKSQHVLHRARGDLEIER